MGTWRINGSNFERRVLGSEVPVLVIFCWRLRAMSPAEGITRWAFPPLPPACPQWLRAASRRAAHRPNFSTRVPRCGRTPQLGEEKS
jgi:hypothetical protein